MPITPTYPGVYIEEIPSGVRTITGVATSITAFVGRAQRGPVNDPVTINSFGDFERVFGGLYVDSALGHAVRDFYLNGGSRAIVVRLYHAEEGTGAEPSKARLTLTGGAGAADDLNLEAAYPGAWGNQLRARVDHDTRPLLPDEAANSLFNLTITDGETGQIEQFRNVSITPGHPRQVDRVLLNESGLVRMTGALPTALPPAQSDDTQVADTDRASEGDLLEDDDFIGTGMDTAKRGLYALDKTDLFNILCIPPYLSNGNVDPTVVTAAAKYCEDRRAMLLVDPPAEWDTVAEAIGDPDATPPTGVTSVGTRSKNAALFFPRLRQPNPLRDNQVENFVPCGAVAGVFARTDATRGIWKAPAGLEATLVGVPQLSVPLTDAENGQLNPLGVNCLRSMPAAGPVVWGSRTLQGDDRLASEWKYVPVRRLALYIEESLYRGTQWVVFEPNDEPLWSQIRLNIGAFMQNLFRQGAFQGKSPQEAYFVKCDSETTTQNDINLGVVNVIVGFAPLRPTEFLIIRIQQMAGQVEA